MPSLSGTVKDSSGAFVARLVRAFRKSDGKLQGSAVSDPGTGAFSITVPYYAPHTVVALDAVVDSSTVLMMNMEGVNTSTQFNEECGKGYTVGGGTTTSTAQAKFGGSSVVFGGTGSFILMTPHTDFSTGTGDFTFECFAKPAASGEVSYIAGAGFPGLAAGWTLVIAASNKLTLWGDSGRIICADGAATISTSAWTHLAVSRQSGVYKTFVGGVLQTTQAGLTGLNHSLTSFCLGADAQYADASATHKYNGALDCVRLTKGLARYTATFTPMTQAVTYMTSYGENSLIYDDVIPV